MNFKNINYGKFIKKFNFLTPNLNIDYLCNKNNIQKIKLNIEKRKGVGDIEKVQTLFHEINSGKKTGKELDILKSQFIEEAHKIPNNTHPETFKLNDDPEIIKSVTNNRNSVEKPLEFSNIAKKLNLLRTEHLGNLTGHRSYYLLGELVELENALIHFTIKNLRRKGFRMVTVPDILPRDVIERCGMNTRGERTQVYTLNNNSGLDLCLSGTSEMALAGLLMNKNFHKDELPVKVLAVSRCYRAETSNVLEERGIYRVHYFTKVEMFGATVPSQSDELLEEFRTIEEEQFTALGLDFKILNMPPHELGAPAYKKYDIEAWLPGRKIYGEISSCSNCTDYQSRRLNIKYNMDDGSTDFVHTLNGTACAIPRMLIAIIESYQQDNGTVKVPDVLSGFMKNKKFISKNKNIPQLKLMK